MIAKRVGRCIALFVTAQYIIIDSINLKLTLEIDTMVFSARTGPAKVKEAAKCRSEAGSAHQVAFFSLNLGRGELSPAVWPPLGDA